ncbi:MAG: hypothetical protein ABI443_04135 [Chthoniobacterales bacterium]
MSIPPFQLPAFRGRFGVARRDITPPLEIYARNWGAASSDTAQSIHRPLTLTALSIQEDIPNALPFIILSLDLGWWRSNEEEILLQKAMRAAGIEADRFIIALSHTHSGPVFSPGNASNPGGEHIAGYLKTVCSHIQDAIAECLRNTQPGILETETGYCSLAENRDLRDPEASRFLVGWNPGVNPDQTILFGRISDLEGKCIATLINYACHPTILAWQNPTISPDYVGAMREVVEKETQALTLFLQGASGELAPRHQYVGDPHVADQAGKCLGHSVLSIFFGMPAPGTKLVYEGAVESGAPLAIWSARQRSKIPATTKSVTATVALDIKHDLPSRNDLEAKLGTEKKQATRERLQRKLLVRTALGDKLTYPAIHNIWQIGPIFFVSVPNEAYSVLQEKLRSVAKGLPVFVVTIANGGRGYLPPEEYYSEDIYSVWQTPFAKGSLEKTIIILQENIQQMMQSEK